MTTVVDASVVVKWFIEEAGSDRASMFRGRLLIAPDLLLVEVGNALWKLQRRGALSDANYADAVEALQAAPIGLEPAAALLPTAARLAAELDHPIYDCFYLALSLREGVPLVTDDRRLLAVASARFGRFVRAL